MSLKSGDKISGRVSHGDKVGRKLGFPTANIEISALSHSDFGVYIARVEIDSSQYYGVLSIGNKATLKQGGTPLAECYIFDFSGDIYSKEIGIIIIDFIRPQIKFSSVEELKQQIAHDVQLAKMTIEKLNNNLKQEKK